MALGEALAYLQSTLLDAVTVLREVMLGATTKPTTKVQAARTLLELGLRSFEATELASKMEELLDAVDQIRHAQT